jgi:hypothetical protein
MVRNVLIATAALSILSAATLTASGVDPFSLSDFPDPTGGLEFVLPDPVCFTPTAGTTDCLENGVINPTSAVSDSYVSGHEDDTFNAQLSVNVFQNGTFEGAGTLTGSIETIDDRAAANDYGSFSSDMPGFSFSGSLPALGPDVELNLTATPPPLTTTTIEPSGGGFQITSFFDVFTELSLDGGSTWTPAPAQAEVDLAKSPEPASIVTAALGFAFLLSFARRRNAR